MTMWSDPTALDVARTEIAGLESEVKGCRDRIAALEAELAEAQENERRINRERAALCTSLDHERAAHERTKAELADVRKDAETFFEMQQRAGEGLVRVAHERDAAQAEALAMREAWKNVDEYCGHDGLCETTDREEQSRQGCDCGYRQTHIAMMAACHGTAGRALAARVPLLETVFEWARKISKQNKTKMQHARASQTEIELAKAVAALDEKGGG